MRSVVLLVFHGTRNTKGIAQMYEVVEQLQAQEPKKQFHGCFLELVEPKFDQMLSQFLESGISEITIKPMFVLPGRHLNEDIPEIIGSAKEKYPEVKIQLKSPLYDQEGFLNWLLEDL